MKQENRYTWNAKDYAKHSSAQQDWARELIAKLKLEGYESVLDIGCGDGKVSAEIADQLPDGHVLGVDNSDGMIVLAQKNFPTAKHPNLEFKLIDAQDLPFKEQFDIVFSNAALHWIRNHKPAILGIKNSLKPSGRVLLQMGGKGNAESVVSLLETMITAREWNQYFSGFDFPYGFYDPETYERWLKEAGLIPTRIELIPKDMSHKDKDAFAGWIRTTWLPYTDRIPADLRQEFITQLVGKYIEKFPVDSMGNIRVKMIRLEVEAIRE